MKINRVVKWMVTATMVSVTVVALPLVLIEVGLFALVAYVAYRVVKLGVILWVMKLFEKRRPTTEIAPVV